MSDSTVVSRVVLENYKSIIACDVQLGPLTFLVGPNGAGKSNFLDALHFVADALHTSLEYAVRERGGITALLSRSGIHTNPNERVTSFGMRIELRLPSGDTGHYAFRLRAETDPWGLYYVEREECVVRAPAVVRAPRDEHLPVYFKVQEGNVDTNEALSLGLAFAPVAARDRLYLVNASAGQYIRPVYDLLSSMRFYSINPASMRNPQAPDGGEMLLADGGNAAHVVARLARKDKETKERIDEYLAKVIGGPTAIAHMKLAPETATALETVGNPPFYLFGGSYPPLALSDGTLHALGVITALFQSPNGTGQRLSLVGIEEPESTLHPAASAVLFDSLEEASRSTQVVVTSHSPDLLDNEDVDADSIRAVVAHDGLTQIGPLDGAGRSALRDHLYTAGELMRSDQLLPDRRSLQDERSGRPALFDE